MTTWTGNKKDEVRTDYIGKTVQKTYKIAAVNLDTGGTLTCTGLKIIDNFVCSVSKAAAGVASIVGFISGNTVTIVHTDPAANATVRITVWGLRG